jgi:hypothetical protein
MASGDQYSTKRESQKNCKEGVKRFLERGFDWIALVIITVIILLSLVFF